MDEEIPYNELLLDVEDGIVVGLYHYLWLKDGKGRACPEVNVPHTIIICNGRPRVWYFTSGKERCIKRKNRANISNATITEALAPRQPATANSAKSSSGAAKASGGGAGGGAGDYDYSGGATAADPSAALLGAWGAPSSPVAPQKSQSQLQRRGQLTDAGQGVGGSGGGAWAYPQQQDRVADGTSTGTALGPWPHHGVVARFQGSMTNPHNAVGGTVNRGASLGRRRKGFELQDEAVEFFTREQLAEMLPPGTAVVHGVAALHEGVLQRFVQPRGQHHFSIRATWSPNACVVERRTSKAKLNDPRVNLADRLAGWDGPNWLSEHTLVTGTVLHGSICRLCDNVAGHLADVSGGSIRVLRMVLYYMVDEANRIWLTHCGTLKTQRLREYVPAGPHLQPLLPAARMRAGGAAAPLLPSGSAALRLRGADGAPPPGGALSGDPSLELPAPSPAFSTTKAAAAAAVGVDGAGAAGGGGSRFLCVLTGEMYASSQRVDVTYKQLLQHWFSLASQLPNEGDRLRAMDTIPLAIRRANPSLTREWYLRVRSQPTFLYRTAPVCQEAVAQITGMAPDELQRTLLPSPSGLVAGAATAATAGAAAGQRSSSPGANTNNGNLMIGGWAAGGLTPQATRGSSPRLGGGEVLSRQGTGGNSTSASAAMRAAQLAGPQGPSLRQRPATALTPVGTLAGQTPLLSHPQQHQQMLPGPFRSASRTQLPPQQPLPQQQPSSSSSRRFATRSKSASPSVAALRTPPPSSNSGGGGGGSVLPSMLLPREAAAAVNGAGGLGHVPSFLQVYGPTPAQAAEAAAVAAVLPYEALNEARHLAAATGQDTAAAEGEEKHAEDEQRQEEEDEDEETVTPRGRCSGDGAGGTGDHGGGGSKVIDRHGDDGGEDDGDISAVDASRRGTNEGLSDRTPTPPPAAGEISSTASSAVHPGGAGAGGLDAGPGSDQGYAAAGAHAAAASRDAAVARAAAGYRSRFPAGRMSTSSEITELGSVASFSEPASPSMSLPGYSPPAGGGGAIAGGGGPPVVVLVGPSRVSPPRSAGLLTLHTIHEEGAAAVPPPLPPPTAASGLSARPASPLSGGAEHFFPPPASRSGAGSHSAPRMRPASRVGALPAGGAAGWRHPGPPQLHGNHHHHHHNHHGGGGSHPRQSSFSENSDVPPLPGGGGGAAAAGGGPSLNSTMASSVGSLSRRSTSNQAVLSTEDMRTLRELSEAYSAAERLTQQLLAQAHEILSEDGGSRPGSTGTSPMHGGRRPLPPPAAAGGSPWESGRIRSGTGTGDVAAETTSRPGMMVGQRINSSSSSSRPTTAATGVVLGPPPRGPREPSLCKTSSGRSGSNKSIGADGGGAPAATAAGPAGTAPPLAAAAVLSRPGSGASGGATQEAGIGIGGLGVDSAACGDAAADAAAAAATQSVPPDLFTSAEADLLAEALQE